MSTSLSLLGAAAFLGTLIAVHLIYVLVVFPGDARLGIKLPLTLDPGISQLMVLPAAHRQPPLDGRIWSPPMAADDTPNEQYGRASNREPTVDEAFALLKAPIGAATVGGIDHRQSAAALLCPPDEKAGPSPVWQDDMDRATAQLSATLDAAEPSADRLILKDDHLVLEGIVTESELVCYGHVAIRSGTVIGACIKVRGHLRVGANVTFLGSVVVNGDIRTEENCVFLFEVVAKGRLTVGKGTRFGRPTGELVSTIGQRRRRFDRRRVSTQSPSDLQYEMRYG
jgi:hypothetical protein